MKRINLIIITALVLIISSCTENSRARNFGGTVDVKIPSNCIVIGATWKEVNLWVLYKDTITNNVFLVEDSNFGILNGRVNFNR